LQEVLNLPPSQSPPTRVVIVNALKRKFGILVNKIYNTDETLSKPLPKYLKNSSFYSGVTIMGDGVISLILDTDGLIRKTHLGKESLNEPIPLYEKNKNIREKQSIILFQCSGEEIYGVDLNMVSRVETINASSIEKIGNSYFVNIKGKTLKVIRPENYLPVTKNEYKNEQLVVIIPNLITNPVSLVVGRIIDSVKAELELDTTQISAQGIWGTIFYNNRIVLMLNLYELSNLANPPATTAKLDVNLKGKNILIAEDTQFFQHVERKYLEDVGCNVTIAINGKEAWELLQTNQYDGVISDIIMPQLNGFELIKLIRNSPSLHDLPAIAVSSVSTEKHIQKALDYGFDAFENKLNKENLIKTFAHIIFNKKREAYTK
ncbi:MAG: chemotaxis protein CheW, partial [Anaerotignaceae bacterium]